MLKIPKLFLITGFLISTVIHSSAQTDVTGKILGETGENMSFTTITVKGIGSPYRQVLVSDTLGIFILKAILPGQRYNLYFERIGYERDSITNYTLSASENSSLLVRMRLLKSELSEVVVVGYGTQKKVNLTGAVSVVKGSDIQNRPVLNATQSLQGMVPGLNVSVGANTKPGQSFNLNIRGAGNLAGGDGPFVLVDGMPMSLTDINPADIESISVLKDAAASAVYGARAPFGVILVTTKKGRPDKMSISYAGNYGLTRPVSLPDASNSYDFAQYFNAATFNAQGSKQYSDEKLELLKKYIENPSGINIFPEATDNYLSNWENTANGVANTNWFKFHYKPWSDRQSHNLSITGGSNKMQYFISGGYFNENGLMRFADMDFDRLNFNSTLTSQITDWLKFRLNTKVTSDKYIAPFSISGTFESLFMHNLARMRPNISPYDLNGNYNEISSVPYFQSGSESTTRNFTFALLPGLEIEPLRNWKFIADFNIRRDDGQLETLLVPGTIYGIDGTPKLVNRSEFAIPIGGSYTRNENNNLYFSPNLYSTYTFSIQKVHSISAMAGFQQELNQFRSLTSSAQDLISFNRPGISLTTTTPTTNESRNAWATRGYFGRLTYNYKEKYLLEINGRYDGSSRFAPDSRWGFFPSMSVGYNLAKEPFMKSLKSVVNNLKIRGSYGLLGNQAGAGLYSYIQSMSIGVPGTNGAGPAWFFQNGREAVIFAPAPFNAFTTWEKVFTKNLGLDFDLLQNKLSGTFEVFQRETRDMLGPTFDIADMFGGAVPPSNNANLRTNGWEVMLSYRNRIGNDINYTVTGVISDNITTITKYENPTFTNPAGAWYVGKRAGEIWGYRAQGLIQNDADAASFNQLDHSFLSPVAWKPGDVRYLDLNNDGKINRGNNRLNDMGDLTVIGNTSPRYAYSLTTAVDWKGLALSFMLQGVGRRDYAPGVGDVYFWGSGALAQVSVFDQHLDYWTSENPGAYYPNPYASPAGSIGSFVNKTQQVSDRYLQNAAYLRLKNLSLGYSLPAAWLQKMRLSRLNLFVTGENLFTITGLTKIFDPETLTGVGGSTTGKIYPLSQVYSIGVNITPASGSPAGLVMVPVILAVWAVSVMEIPIKTNKRINVDLIRCLNFNPGEMIFFRGNS